MLEERLVGHAGREVVQKRVERTLGRIGSRDAAFGLTTALSSRANLVKSQARRGRRIRLGLRDGRFGGGGRRRIAKGTQAVEEIRGGCEGANVLLIGLGEFLDAGSAQFPPRSRDTFGPF
jgi:hypothetical protein